MNDETALTLKAGAKLRMPSGLEYTFNGETGRGAYSNLLRLHTGPEITDRVYARDVELVEDPEPTYSTNITTGCEITDVDGDTFIVSGVNSDGSINGTPTGTSLDWLQPNESWTIHQDEIVHVAPPGQTASPTPDEDSLRFDLNLATIKYATRVEAADYFEFRYHDHWVGLSDPQLQEAGPDSRITGTTEEGTVKTYRIDRIQGLVGY